MSTEENKALLRRFYRELVDQGNLAIIDELIAPDMVEHEELPPGIPPGREGVKQFFALMRSAFPDVQVAVEDMLAEGDKVVARVTFRGTHRGEFIGVPASGKQVAFTAIDILRIVDGRLVEHWGQTDNLGMLQQIGAIPPPQ
jgi:steroid delta-isomerase-like uncharacterized protein